MNYVDNLTFTVSGSEINNNYTGTQPVTTYGLVSWWKCNNEVRDYIGARDGTINNKPYWTAGYKGKIVSSLASKSGTAVRIQSQVLPASIVADGISTSTLSAQLVDGDNNVVITATNTVVFSITGQGTWIDGTTTNKNVLPTNGIATITVKSTAVVGNVMINCNSAGLEGSVAAIQTIHGTAYKLKNDVY